MQYLLVIGDISADTYRPYRRKSQRIVRITTHQAAQGSSWPENESADRLRELFGCEPTDIYGIIMPEKTWLDSGSIVTMQFDYMPNCDGNRWVVRPDGTIECV